MSLDPSALKAPEDCASLAELREQIDGMDRILIALMARRARYVERVAPFKIEAGLPAAAPDRVAAVLEKVRALAEAEGLDPDLAAKMWGAFIDWAIAHEEEVISAAKG